MAIKFLNTVAVDTDVLYVDASSNRVGIGTTSPAKKLTIGGIGLGNTDGLKIEDPSNTAYGAHYSYNDGSTTVEIGGVVNNALRDCISIARDATRTITIDTSERVGIGTTSPTTKLHVYGNLRLGTTGDFYITQSPFVTNTFYVRTATAGTVTFGAPTSFQQNVSVQGDLYVANGSSSTAIGTKRFGNWSNKIVDTGDNYFNIQGGNFGIGTTSPSSKLQVNGDLTVGDDSTIGSFINVIAAGASQDAGIRFGSESNTDSKAAIYTNTSNSDLHFDVTETTRMLIDSGTGNVGIGTTSPGAKLEVEQSNSSTNTVFLSNSYNNKGFRTGNSGYATFSGYQDANNTSSGGAYGALIGLNTFYNGTNFYNDNQYVDPSSILFKDGNILFHTNDISATGNFTPNERLRITKTGNVGIGTTSPAQKLDVAGDATFDGRIYTNATALASVGILGKAIANGWAARYDSNNANYSGFYFDTNNHNIIIGRVAGGTITNYIAASGSSYFNGGNVGIGETNPAQKLHVIGNSEITGDIFLGRYIFHNDDTNTWLGFPLADTISFRTNGSDRMYITSSGNVGIGTTSPTSRLHVAQQLTSPTAPMVRFVATRTSSTYGGVNVRVDNVDYGTGMRFYRSGTYDSNAVSFYNGASQVGSINISTSSTSYNTTSDYRLKENLTEITDGIYRIKQLKPKRFNFIGDTSVVDGFIAHEAKQVVPEAVTGEKDEVLPNGDPVYQGIDQAKIVPLLTAALQEAITKIEVLENRLQILENK